MKPSMHMDLVFGMVSHDTVDENELFDSPPPLVVSCRHIAIGDVEGG